MALILGDMKTQLSELLQDQSATIKVKFGSWINQGLQDVARRFSWRELQRNTEINLIAGEEDFFLPKDVDTTISLSIQSTPTVLASLTEDAFQKRHVSDATTQGQPEQYRYVGETSAKATPTSASTIRIVSADALDITQIVRIWGLSGGEDFAENLSLNGTSNVESTNTFTRVDRVSKSADTAGIITISSNSGAVEIATLGALDSEVRYKRFRIHRIPSVATTLFITYKKRARHLEDDNDIPEIDVDQLLIKYAHSKGLEEQRQHQKGAQIFAEYLKQLDERIAQEEQSRDGLTQFIPHIEQRR